MQEIKNTLENLRDDLSVNTFDLYEFLGELEEIDNEVDVNVFGQFCGIWEMGEVLNYYEFDDEVLDFINENNDAEYIDIDNLQVITFDHVVERLNVFINAL